MTRALSVLVFSTSFLIAQPAWAGRADAPMPLEIKDPAAANTALGDILSPPPGSDALEARLSPYRETVRDVSGHVFRRFIYENGPSGGRRIKALFEYGPSGRRVARWRYASGGQIVKSNRIYESDVFRGKFNEYLNARGVKYREAWYDERNKIVCVKRWLPDGRFNSHALLHYASGRLEHINYFNREKQVIRRSFFDEKGRLERDFFYGPEETVFRRLDFRYHRWLFWDFLRRQETDYRFTPPRISSRSRRASF